MRRCVVEGDIGGIIIPEAPDRGQTISFMPMISRTHSGGLNPAVFNRYKYSVMLQVSFSFPLVPGMIPSARIPSSLTHPQSNEGT